MGIHRIGQLVVTSVALGALALASVACSGASTTPQAVTTVPVNSNWTTYNLNGARTGVDPSGLHYSVSSPAWTSSVLDGSLFGQPLTEGGTVVVATENNTVYALSAANGSVEWSKHIAAPFDPSSVAGLCGNIRPTVGITSTPVIDPARSEIFVVADEAVGTDNAAHHLVGLNLDTGHIVLDEVIDPAGTDVPYELQRPALALTDGRVIVGFGGNSGDCGFYHGYVVSAPENGAAPSDFEVSSLPGDSQGAVWMGGGAPTIDAQGNVWVATGNGNFESSTDEFDNSDAVLELSPTMQLVQAFAPKHWYTDNAEDLDFSTPPVLLGNGLVLALGKSSTAYVLHQGDLGGVNGQITSTAACFGHGPSAQVGNIVYMGCSGGLVALQVTGAASGAKILWKSTSGTGGAAIVAGGLVWGISQAGTLEGLNPTNGSVIQATSLGAEDNDFPSPSVGDGLLLAPSANQVHAFGSTSAPAGYRLTASDGGVFSYGQSPFLGSAGGMALNKPIVGSASTADGGGYWLVASDGGIFAYGDARYFGSTGATTLNKPIVGMAASPDSHGYWLVASDGGIFAFGDARFYGSTGGTLLNKPIVGMAASVDGQGYWLVASDGGIFSFGNALFSGSTGGTPLNQPIVGMAATHGGAGYWLVASDGGIFAFGDARFYGSTGGTPLNEPIVGMTAAPGGAGYWLVASDGGIFSYGTASFYGSAGGTALNKPIVALTYG